MLLPKLLRTCFFAVSIAACWSSSGLQPADQPAADFGAAERAEAARRYLFSVKMFEIDRTRMRKDGFDLPRMLMAEDAAQAVRVLEELKGGSVTQLAHANLMLRFGRQGQFLEGGTIPLPTPAGSKQPPRKIRFGTEVTATASPLGEDRVKIATHARYSNLATRPKRWWERGKAPPTIRARECQFTAEPKLGETLLVQGAVAMQKGGPNGGERVFVVAVEVQESEPGVPPEIGDSL